MQKVLMKFDPATGEENPYPSHAQQWRDYHGKAAWLFNPWTGKQRSSVDVGSDIFGLLIYVAGEPMVTFPPRQPQVAAMKLVATVAEIHMSRYTLDWTNGPLPEGTPLYAI